ncbi:hypothetical protein CRG98_046711 [Punica granatum]|uniref:Uncharacterized protein n=1 Tax=Punica granatum TaxID=22663 RepID=A0A2I0HMJ1_PUNGR|nr:hypothetical protein CRG98_046711 [Punica granatum]
MGSQTRQGCKRHERGGSANLRCRKTRQDCKRHEGGGSKNLRRRKVSSHGLADPARLQEARARWFGELAVQENKLARQTRQGCKRHERGGSANLRCRKVSSHWLADPARLQQALARWLYELAVQESCKRHERGSSKNLRCKKVNSHGLADPARLQEARGRWLEELAAQENPARLQEARGRWLEELAAQESKLARVRRPAKVVRGTSKVARRTCGAGNSKNLRCKKVNSHRFANPARLQEARGRWLGELAAQESKLARVSRPDKVARGTSEVARRNCGAGK